MGITQSTSTPSNSSTFEAVSTSLSEQLNSTFIAVSQSSVSSTNPTQTLKISNINTSGTFTANNISQVIVAKIDAQKFVNSVSETKLQSSLKSALTATVKNNQTVESGLFGGSVRNSASTKVYNENINRVVNSYSYAQFQNDANSIFGSQDITFSDITAGSVNLSNISQYIQTEILCKQMASIMTSTIEKIMTENGTYATSETTQTAKTGLTSDVLNKILMIAAIVFVVIIAIVVIFFVVRNYLMKAALGAVTGSAITKSSRANDSKWRAPSAAIDDAHAVDNASSMNDDDDNDALADDTSPADARQ